MTRLSTDSSSHIHTKYVHIHSILAFFPPNIDGVFYFLVYGNLPPVPITYLFLLYLRFPTTVLSLILLSLQLLSIGTLCINLYQAHFSNNLRKVNKIFFFLNVSLVYLLPALSLPTSFYLPFLFNSLKSAFFSLNAITQVNLLTQRSLIISYFLIQ